MDVVSRQVPRSRRCQAYRYKDEKETACKDQRRVLKTVPREHEPSRETMELRNDFVLQDIPECDIAPCGHTWSGGSLREVLNSV